jgi:dihydroorotate dehydrogenase electron transfer subunit
MQKKIFQTKARITYNKKVKGDYRHCVFVSGRIARAAECGQFVNIKVAEGELEPLLRRPFSIHRVAGDSVEILYEVVGRGSSILAERRPGEYLDIIGPLGNTFDWRAPSAARTPVLVAGGMGVAPLAFLAQEIAGLNPAKIKGRRLSVFIGARTREHILCEKEFRDLGFDIDIATDDGSRGFKGRVTGLLEERLKSGGRECAVIYACGPKPMLKALSEVSRKYKIPAQLSLEAHMACGFGACLGCVVDTINGYRRVCKDGPVFAADEVIW